MPISASWRPAATAWCEAEGAESVADIKEVGEGAAFVDALGELKPIKKKKLLLRLG